MAPPLSAMWASVLVLVLCVTTRPAQASTGGLADLDYGGIPLWVNRLLGEPSVLSLRGRMDRAWYRANNPGACPDPCDCPVHWPTAVYCDHKALGDVPDNLPATTRYLFLQANNISSLPSSSALANATDLRWLILDQNQLRSNGAELAALKDMTRLQYLFANHNRLTTVPAGLPAGLQQLRLAHNRITSITRGAFQNLQNLSILLLQGNRLSTLTPNDLTGLVQLNLLDLSGNLFSSVPRHLPPSVQQLYLSNNSLSGVGEDSLAGLGELRFLRLSRCGLRSPALSPHAFNLTSLVELDLSHNLLTHTPAVPSTLQYLYLEANQIHQFNVKSFCREVGPLSYSRMRILRLDGNKMAAHQLPPDWVHCLRVLHHMYI